MGFLSEQLASECLEIPSGFSTCAIMTLRGEQAADLLGVFGGCDVSEVEVPGQ